MTKVPSNKTEKNEGFAFKSIGSQNQNYLWVKTFVL